MSKQAKRGQVALFIIIAVIIVAAIMLLLVMRGRVAPKAPEKPAEPKSYIVDCVELALKPLIENMSVNLCGVSSELCYIYKGYSVPILCFSDVPGEQCQRRTLLPILLNETEKEILNSNISSCINYSVRELEKKGFTVTRCEEEKLNWTLTFIEDQLILTIDCPLIVTKEATVKYQTFEISENVEFRWPDELQPYIDEINETLTIEENGDFDPSNPPANVRRIEMLLIQERQNYWIKIFNVTKDSGCLFAVKEIK